MKSNKDPTERRHGLVVPLTLQETPPGLLSQKEFISTLLPVGKKYWFSEVLIISLLKPKASTKTLTGANILVPTVQ